MISRLSFLIVAAVALGCLLVWLQRGPLLDINDSEPAEVVRQVADELNGGASVVYSDGLDRSVITGHQLSDSDFRRIQKMVRRHVESCERTLAAERQNATEEDLATLDYAIREAKTMKTLALCVARESAVLDRLVVVLGHDDPLPAVPKGWELSVSLDRSHKYVYFLEEGRYSDYVAAKDYLSVLQSEQFNSSVDAWNAQPLKTRRELIEARDIASQRLADLERQVTKLQAAGTPIPPELEAERSRQMEVWRKVPGGLFINRVTYLVEKRSGRLRSSR